MHSRGLLNQSASSTDDHLVLVCVNCARIVVFDTDGWRHRDPDTECRSLVVAWPPPGAEDDEAAHDAA